MVFAPLILPFCEFLKFLFLEMYIMLRRNECRMNSKNRPVRTGDLKGGPKQPPLPLIGVARSLPLIGLKNVFFTLMTSVAKTIDFSRHLMAW